MSGRNTSNIEADGRILPGIMRNQMTISKPSNPIIPHILPHEKVFPIQIGNELFRLSGASISSDAPSYFSAFFQCQLNEVDKKRQEGDVTPAIRTLYIDRDPVTFGDISRHLQGYHVVPRDGAHFVKLFADAQFYQLPRLVDQLYEEAIYISIGGREFKIYKDLFSGPGDSPNYFTLGYAFLFSNPTEVFPGLDRDGLLRPPSIMPPAIPNHSADIFADLLHVMQGYPLHVRNEQHRKELLQDCRYFLFKGVEQKLIPHLISFNPSRTREEIVLRLEDLRQPGLSYSPDPSLMDKDPGTVGGWVNYARPYVDDKNFELVVEIGHEWMRLDTFVMRAELLGDGRKRMTKLFEVIANKLNCSYASSFGDSDREPNGRTWTPPNNNHVKFIFDQSSTILDNTPFTRSDGVAYDEDMDDGSDLIQLSKKRKRKLISETGEMIPRIWTVKTGQWRIRIHNFRGKENTVEFVLVGVKIDAVSGEQARNAQRSFLGR